MTTTTQAVYLPYAGIGSRETPENAMHVLYQAGKRLAERGFTLRSGAAEGADTAFEEGCDQASYQGGPGKKEIFIPWAGYNGRPKSEFGEPPELAYEVAERIHPAWHHLKRGGRTLMARNCQQIMGQNLGSHALFVLCWTKGGKGAGGTGQAIRLAKSLGIPVFDIGDPNLEFKTIATAVDLIVKNHTCDKVLEETLGEVKLKAPAKPKPKAAKK